MDSFCSKDSADGFLGTGLAVLGAWLAGIRVPGMLVAGLLFTGLGLVACLRAGGGR
ncbi:hypothetical protein [Pseudoxanthomonas sp. J35]|uniref:hypothetical protein n=1 Tax=Pseudoxanthomonas sp. J35 TaxID=935852 RepID=UPI0004AE8494|nr:hypothetical protein [Pseudoxanthomonas sp. J35]